MTLFAGLILRLAAVAVACGMGASAYILFDVGRTVREEATAVAGLVAHQIESAQVKSASGFDAGPTFRVVDELPASALGAGRCIRYAAASENWSRCSGSDVAGEAVPGWFSSAFRLASWEDGPVSRTIRYHGADVATLTIEDDAASVAGRAWLHVRTIAGVTIATTLAMTVPLFAAVGHLLLPARRVIEGLHLLQHGDYESRLSSFRAVEFDRVSVAFNELAERLQRITAERSALTRRLIQVQEEERQALARDLHDEFGQCLTAIQSLAAALEIGAGRNRAALVDDARLIGRIAAAGRLHRAGSTTRPGARARVGAPRAGARCGEMRATRLRGRIRRAILRRGRRCRAGRPPSCRRPRAASRAPSASPP